MFKSQVSSWPSSSSSSSLLSLSAASTPHLGTSQQPSLLQRQRCTQLPLRFSRNGDEEMMMVKMTRVMVSIMMTMVNDLFVCILLQMQKAGSIMIIFDQSLTILNCRLFITPWAEDLEQAKPSQKDVTRTSRHHHRALLVAGPQLRHHRHHHHEHNVCSQPNHYWHIS